MQILRFCTPAIIACVVTRTQTIVNLMFLGHLGDKNLLAGIGLGNNFIMLMGMMFIFGMLMAMDTLISQSKGAGNVELCGVYLNRSRFIVTLLFIPLCILSFYVEWFYNFIGMNPEVSYYAEQYVLSQIIGTYFYALNTCQVKFLNNMGKTRIPMISGTISMLVHPIWSYFLCMPQYANLGIVGIGIGTSLTFANTFFINLISSWYLPDLQKAIFMPDRRVFQDIKQYLKLGLPGVFMISLDISTNIFVNIAAGWISVDCQSAQVILLNIGILLYFVGIGLQ